MKKLLVSIVGCILSAVLLVGCSSTNGNEVNINKKPQSQEIAPEAIAVMQDMQGNYTLNNILQWKYTLEADGNTVILRLYATREYLQNVNPYDWNERTEMIDNIVTRQYLTYDGRVTVMALICENNVPDAYYFKLINGERVYDPVNGIAE